jgi:hypothetical protein
MVPVQPRWDSPQELLGFYNYIEQRYRATEFARALVHFDSHNWPAQAKPWNDRLLIVLLDEMNLARVEYYFSEFLSRLEKRPHDAGATADGATRIDAEIVVDVPKIALETTPRIYPSERLLFVGTMNEDESTQSLSDKVLDRANLMRFPPPTTLVQTTRPGVGAPTGGFLSVEAWRGWKRSAENLTPAERGQIAEVVQTMNGHCGRLARAFGHRTSQSIAAYVANYPRDGHEADWRTALADQLELRILPRLRGVDADAARPEIEALRTLADARLGDPVLATAIERSLESAAGSGGLFVWQGVAREG